MLWKRLNTLCDSVYKSHITSEHPYELTFKSKLLDECFYVDEMDFINYFVKRKNGQLELANRTLNT